MGVGEIEVELEHHLNYLNQCSGMHGARGARGGVATNMTACYCGAGLCLSEERAIVDRRSRILRLESSSRVITGIAAKYT
jgi:uncharacterized protein YfiM (DUF2279 family)